MSLTTQVIATAEHVLSERPDGDFQATFAALRAALPGMVVLRCDASDVLEEPYRSFPAIDLHLVDTRNHCTEMTTDPEAATALLIAAKAVTV